MDNLSIFALHKQESKHLKEWIDYHLEVGVNRFYLQDNNDPKDEATADVLAPYIASGVVVPGVLEGKNHRQQVTAYNNFLDTKPETMWLALIDVDEFLYPVHVDTMTELLPDYRKHAGLVVNQRVIGASGCAQSPSYVTEENVTGSNPGHILNFHVKMIVRPERIATFLSVHTAHTLPGYNLCNENHEPVYGASVAPVFDKVALYHYAVRSDEDFAIKSARGGGNSLHRGNESYKGHYDRNEVPVTDLKDRYLARVKARA